MSLAHRISCFNRKRKYICFLNATKPSKEDKVLDVGFTDIEISPFDNYLERNYPYPENITALSIEKPKDFKKRYPKVKAITYDGNEFPFLDNFLMFAGPTPLLSMWEILKGK